MRLVSRIEPKWGWLAFALYLLEAGLWNPHASPIDGVWYWSLDFFRFLALPVALLFAAARLSAKSKGGLDWIGGYRNYLPRFTANDVWDGIGGILLCWILMWVMSYVSNVFVGSVLHTWFGVPDRPDTFGKVLARYEQKYRIPLAFYLAFCAALVEELYYRCLADRLAQGFKKPNANRCVYYALGVGVFAAFHWPSGAYAIGGAIGAGLVTCLFYRKTGKLSIVFGAHFLFDFVLNL